MHPDYAASLREFGKPRLLPRSGSWILERSIGDLGYKDAMGCYPIFCCLNWDGLRADLDELSDELVSISMVVDPFGPCTEEALRACFEDKVVRFKQHFVADLRRPTADIVSHHHHYYAKRALKTVRVERCDDPSKFLNEWIGLYGNLIARHNLSGIKAFSRSAFTAQLSVPGIVVFRAVHGLETVGAHLWYVQGDIVYSHLAATNRQGYELGAAYALYITALETFSKHAHWINFGSGAGVNPDESDGLARFKKGWSTETLPTYFCGRIFNREKYNQALLARAEQDNDYFPAYRRGEFS